MRKTVFLLVFVIMLIPSVVSAEAVDYDWINETSLKLDEITLSNIVTYTRGQNNIPNGAGQGFAVTPTHFVFAQVIDNNSNTYIYFVNRKTLEIDKIINDHCFGHANDFTYNSKTKQLVLPYTLNSKKYVAYFDAVNLTYIESKEVNLSGYAIAYDVTEDKYYMGSSVTLLHTDRINLDFSNAEKVFDNNDYGSKYLVKQGMAINDNRLYFALWEGGVENIYQTQKYSSARKNDNIITIYNKNGEYQKALYIKKLTGTHTPEIESIDFDENGEMYLFYNGSDIAIYKMNYETGTVSLELTIDKKSIKDNQYKFKLMDGDNLVEEKSNTGDKVTFSEINNLGVGTKNYKIIDEDDNKEYNVKVKVTADTYNKKLIYNISYDNKDELVIDKNEKEIIDVPNTLSKNSIYYVLIGISLVLVGSIVYIKNRKDKYSL